MALVGLLVAATAVLTIGGLPQAAYAAEAQVADVGQLQAALLGTDSPIVLTASLGDATTTELTVNRDVTLDLNGHTLTANNTTITAGHTLTLLINSGTNLSYTMDVEGTLKLASDLTVPPNFSTPVTVGVNGKITTDGTPRTLSGAPGITNNGVITGDVTIGASTTVTGNSYTARFVDNLPSDNFHDVHVYAPTFAAAGLTLPTIVRTHATIASWNSEADGTGNPLTTTTPLSTIPGAWGLYYAQWAASGITSIAVSYDGSPSAVGAGTTALTATDTTPGGTGGDITDLVNFSSSNPADSIDVYDNFYKPLNAQLAGSRVVTATLKADPTVKNTVTVPVTHSEDIDEITLAMSPTTVVTDKTSIAYLSATDYYGNSFGHNLIGGDYCDWCELTVTSSDPTDVIDPATGTITFTTLGLHTITAEINMGEGGTLTATAAVTVVPAPAPSAQLKTLAVTGYDPTTAPWFAGLLMLLGLAAILVDHRRRRA